jgi:ubiquinone/menaquinone biosynthesis C-methylase UbiE
MTATGLHVSNNWEGYPKSAGQKYQDWRDANPDVTVGWEPSCDCGLDPVPQTVLDPFCGTGRTLYAALKLGRNAVGYDISETYCEMARKRCGSLLL